MPSIASHAAHACIVDTVLSAVGQRAAQAYWRAGLVLAAVCPDGVATSATHTRTRPTRRTCHACGSDCDDMVLCVAPVSRRTAVVRGGSPCGQVVESGTCEDRAKSSTITLACMYFSNMSARIPLSTSDLPSAATQKASPEATRQLAWHAPFALPDNTAPKRHQRHRMWSHPRLCRPTLGPDCELAREPVERYNEVSVAKHGPLRQTTHP